ncbi:MAG: iron-sulfur cluster assembly accessory protein, partial [FCB group bacterium]|nr:iron-sulfur cluster assembly accessory protein [FCB group bacterium]
MKKSEVEDTIFITPVATAEVKRLIAEQKEDNSHMLRIGVEGGGCSGLSYAMSFEKEAGEYDKTFEFDG